MNGDSVVVLESRVLQSHGCSGEVSCLQPVWCGALVDGHVPSMCTAVGATLPSSRKE